MSDSLKMTRRPIFKAPLKAVSFTLRKDQAEYLGRMSNASEFIRDLIDQHLRSEEHPTSLVAMLAKLSALKEERNDILGSPECAFDEEDFDASPLEEGDSTTLAVKDDKVYHEFYTEDDYDEENPEYILLPLSVGDLKSFRDGHDVDNLSGGRYRIWLRDRTLFAEFIKASLVPDSLVIETLEVRLKEIEVEIEKLEGGIGSATQGAAKR